jgi:PAS domain S-box-containing protein
VSLNADPTLEPGEISAQLLEILRTRRQQIGFRATIPVVMGVFFTSLLGVLPVLAWALAYGALQIVEVWMFPARRLNDKAPSPVARGPALLLFFLNSVVFGAASVMWATSVGSWGLACGGYLIAGAMLNVVLTTPGCRAAFQASITPYFGYVAIAPFIAISRSGFSVAAALGIAGAMMAYCAFKLWTQSSRTRDAEMNARRELGQRAAKANSDRAFFDAVVENIPAMLVVKDATTGRFALLNTAGEALLQTRREDVIGKTDHDLFPADQADFFVKCDREVLASGEALVVTAETLSTPSGDRTLRTKKVVISGEDGPQYLLAIAEDITEQETAALALEQALGQAQAANVAKSTFLATMSHEIRTPLNGVLGMAQAMAADTLSQRQRKRVDVIRESGESLLAILNDVLDLSKIEAGKLELEDIDFELEEVARGAYAAFTSLANKIGVSFGLDLSNATGRYRGDPTRLRQIFYNLISNALKFTTSGEIRVTASYDGEALQVAVADTGIGMEPETVARLFTNFGQADASTTRRFGGSGLGLVISLELAKRMGGNIDVESTFGKGSTFTLTVPLPQVSTQAPNPDVILAVPSPADQLQLRVLAAEDNMINQLVLRTLLAQIGIDPVIVENGNQAVEAWEGGEFDLVLMDVQMPEMDGPTAARRIREREALGGRGRTPIIALTANVMSHQVADYLAAGMDGHLAKPIEAAKLFAALQAVLDAASLRSAPRALKRQTAAPSE